MREPSGPQTRAETVHVQLGQSSPLCRLFCHCKAWRLPSLIAAAFGDRRNVVHFPAKVPERAVARPGNRCDYMRSLRCVNGFHPGTSIALFQTASIVEGFKASPPLSLCLGVGS